MKSKSTPWTHTAKTTEELTLEVGPGRLKPTVTVPVGTECRLLEGGSSATWVVSDLRFIEDKHSMLYHDADHYGIRIPEDKLTDIKPVR